MGLFTKLTDTIGLTNYGAAQRAIEQANSYFSTLTLPELRELGLESVGDMTPDQIRTFLMENTAFDDIYLDPRLKESQMRALEQLQEISDSEGITAQDRARLERIRMEEETRARGAREAILQGAQQRGIGGSGIELMAQMQNQQEAATRQSMRDTEVAAQAEQRRMDAILGAGNLGGQMRSQEFGEQSRTAEARDALQRFNLANQQQTEAQNVAARNAAQQYNLANQQQIANQNKQWLAAIPQQNFQNQLGIASAQAGGQYQLANMFNQQSATNMQMAGMAALAYAKSDEDEKKDVSLAPDEIDAFLNELTGYKYSYKRPESKDEEGPRLGIMAQDMEKSNLGQKAVTEMDGVKMIDGKKAVGTLLASVGRLNERLNKLEDENESK